MGKPGLYFTSAKRIPNNKAKFVPNEGNLLIYSHWREMMKELVISD
jgi:hypothetical protein